VIACETNADRLRTWWESCRANPGSLPPGVTQVQGRLIRVVGKGVLPDGTAAFLKVMAFPRAKDKLRYLHRALPAVHEARLLHRLAALGIPVPRVLFARGERRALLPRLSLLVSEGLPLAATAPNANPPPVASMAELAKRLCDAGIVHADLNPGNFAQLSDGKIAVLDFQSARDQGAPLSARERLAVAAKLLHGLGSAEATAEVLLAAGLLMAPFGALDLRAAAAGLERKHLQKRIARCLHESTEFTRRIGVSGLLHRRRACDPATGQGSWIAGGAELGRWWIGDRALEVLDGRQPLLGAWFRNSCWLLARGRLYIPGPSGHEVLRDQAPALEEGYARYREMRRQRSRPEFGMASGTGATPPGSSQPPTRS